MKMIKKLFNRTIRIQKEEKKYGEYTLSQLACFHDDKRTHIENEHESIVMLECGKCNRVFTKHFPHNEYYMNHISPHIDKFK